MIFVTVGTNEARFDRLLRAVAAVPAGEPLVVQYGHSTGTLVPHAEHVDFLAFDDLAATIRRARAVVTHAGVGSVLVALANGKRPVVVPRLKAFGEAVDDHQLELGRRLAGAGLVTLVEDPERLGEALDRDHTAAPFETEATPLAAELRRFLDSAVRPEPVAVRA